MYILLIIWLIFLFAYIIFNVYGIYRVLAMRIKGDIIPLAVIVYTLVMFAVIIISLIFIYQLNWTRDLKELFNF